MGFHFVMSNITDTRINTAIVRDWVVSGKELDPGLCDLERRDVVVVEGMHHLHPCFFG
jgi:hypothetical protein